MNLQRKATLPILMTRWVWGLPRVALVGLVGAWVACTSGILGDPSPLPPVLPAPTLLLEQTDLDHRQFSVDRCEPYCALHEHETEAGRSFNQALVSQGTYRFDSDRAAQAKFDERRQALFTPTGDLPFAPFKTPSEFGYRSPIANDFYIACGFDLAPRCWAIARYRNYVVQTGMFLDYVQVDGRIYRGDGLRLSKFEPFLRAVDRRVGERLRLPPPDPHKTGP